jgi:hypothetical protein
MVANNQIRITMRKSIILAAVLVAAATSCQKAMMQEPESLGTFSIRATREACADTKASINSTSGAFTWSAGDAIGIWNGSSFQEMTTQDDGVASATFNGTYEGTLSGYAVYPSAIGKSVSGSDVTVTLPDSYKWKEGEVAAPMLATYDASSLSFKHLGGVVMVTLNNVPANAAKFVFNTDKDITGDYTVTSGGEIQSAGKASNNEVTFTFTLDTATDMEFYVPVPVGEYTFGFTLYDADDKQIDNKQGTTANAVNRAVLLKMPALTYFSISGGGEGTTSTTSIPAGHEGTFYLPDTSSDVIVNIDGDCKAGAVKLVYAAGGATPANVTINANGHTVSSLAIELPDSHVNVVGGTYTTITSQTSLSTLVLDKDVTVTDLTIEKGSALVSATVTNMTVSSDVVEDAKIEVTSEGKVTTKLENNSQTSIIVEAPADDTSATPSNIPSEGVTTTNGGNTVTITPAKYLQKQIEAGGTVTLEQDITVSDYIAIRENKTTVLNLNGHKITSSYEGEDYEAIYIENGGTLTINGGENGEISSVVTTIGNKGTLTVNGGTYKSSSNVAIFNLGTATLNDGSYIGNIGAVGNAHEDANLIVNGGYYEMLSPGEESYEQGVFNNLGDITFNKAISYKGPYSVYMEETPIGGHLYFGKGVSLSMVYACIYDGSIDLLEDGSEDPNEVIIEEVRAYVADEAALKEAFANTNVDVVFLNQDLSLSETIILSIDKDLNLNGKTLTYTGGGSDAQCCPFRVKDGTFTVKGTGGSIVAADDSHTERNIFFANGETAKIVLEADATYKVGKCTTAGATDWYNVVYANKTGATVEISAGEFILESTCSKYILNIKNSTAEEKTAGTIYGNISVKGGTFHGYNPATGDDSGSVSTFVADGYAALETEEGSNIWKVQEVAVNNNDL